MGENVWTYARLAAEVDRLARGLVGRGLKRGDRVALHLPNGPELAVAYYACFRIGAIAAPLNNRMKHAELLPLLQRLRPTLYIGQRDLYAKVAAVDSSILPTNARFLIDAGSRDPRTQPWTRLFSDVIGGTLHVDVDVDAPALLLTTSGSTGQSKFVAHTLSTLAAISQAIRHLGLDGSRVAVLAAPMVHASGCFSLLGGIWHGAPMIMFRRFDADAVLDAIRPRECSFMLGLPYMFVELLNAQRARPRSVDSLRLCASGGDVCPLWLQAQFPEHFGVPLYSIWGATETVGSLTYSTKAGPVHGVVPGTEHRLLDERGNEVRPGEVGELSLRGPNVTIGYWAGPGRIEGLAEDGWYMTGDLLRQDEDGDLWYVSRKKDLIIRGGSNIAPAEVERVLTAHRAVRDAGVVGVPDVVLGQRVAGFVTLAEDAGTISAEEILADIAPQLADYKLPERLRIVETIPRNTLGKIDRRALLAMVPANSAETAGIPAATAPLRLGRR
jgi:acyl-CoA synthetase (AMP-forming)/AMP-acid ligase II